MAHPNHQALAIGAQILTSGPPHALNWTVGWMLILSGFVVGALLGLGFHRPGFLGGYDSFRRRLIRLGHIALEALGVINIVFALGAWPAPGTLSGDLASTCFIIGGISMPLICFLAAWKPGFRHLFFIPVSTLFIAVATTAFLGGVQ